MLLAGCEAAVIASNVLPAVSSAVASQGGGVAGLQSGPVPAKCPPPGTIVSTSNARTTVHLRQQADSEVCWMTMSDVAGFVPMLHGVWPVNWDGTGDIRRGLREVFPLAPQRSADITVLRHDGNWRLKFLVEGETTISAPAGTFSVWVLRYTEDAGFGGGFFGERRLFIDKPTGALLRAESRVLRGIGRVGWENFDVVSVRLPR